MFTIFNGLYILFNYSKLINLLLIPEHTQNTYSPITAANGKYSNTSLILLYTEFSYNGFSFNLILHSYKNPSDEFIYLSSWPPLNRNIPFLYFNFKLNKRQIVSIENIPLST